MNGVTLMVDHIHVVGEDQHGERATGPRGQQERGEHSGEQNPEQEKCQEGTE
jgi:hypothetical protein